MLNRTIPQSIDDVTISEATEDKLVVQINKVTIPYIWTLRKMMYRYVPTMAIDKIYVYNNTSSIPYELLARRISLTPIKADARQFDFFDGAHTEHNTLIFDLKKSGPEYIETIDNPSSMNVTSGDFEWIPFEDVSQDFGRTPEYNQSEKFKNDPIRVSDPNYLLLKLKPTQELNLRCLCLKGSGKFHTRFSPVSNVYYEKIGEDTDILIEGTSMEPLLLESPKPIFRQDLALHKYIDRKTMSGEVTVSEYSLLYPVEDFKFTLETKGQLSPEEVLNQAIKITETYMEKPYSERFEDIGFPGYIY